MEHEIDCQGCGATIARTDDASLVKLAASSTLLCVECDENSNDTPEVGEGDE